jgi:hypothetical protein
VGPPEGEPADATFREVLALHEARGSGLRHHPIEKGGAPFPGPRLRFSWSGRLRDQVDDVDRCREIGHIRDAVLHSSFERIPDGRQDGQ